MNSEADLLKSAKSLDTQGLAEIYDRYSPDLYRYALRLLGNPVIAEDCVAATFDHFLCALHHGNGPHSFLRAYLYRIAHNWITDLFRRDIPYNELDEALPDSAPMPEEETTHRSQLDCLKQAIRLLTPDQRQVITLKFWENWENSEIAHAIDKPIGAVKSLQHRALNALQRNLLERENP